MLHLKRAKTSRFSKRVAAPTGKVADKRTGAHMSSTASNWWEKEVKGKKELRVCSRCHAVYFDKHWHTIPGIFSWMKKRGIAADGRCLECTWVTRGTRFVSMNYEGEVILEGLSSQKEKQEILKLVRNVGARASLRDPEDQIMGIEDKVNKVIVRTTENQLAISIGKQVARAFKGGDLEIKYSHEDAPVRVYWRGGKVKGKE
ncbi:MAG: hypothetical protein AAB444_00975 [Patescibacteria group bacterium]